MLKCLLNELRTVAPNIFSVSALSFIQTEMCSSSHAPSRNLQITVEIRRSRQNCRYSAWNFFHATVLEPGISRWLLDLWKTSVSPRIGWLFFASAAVIVWLHRSA